MASSLYVATSEPQSGKSLVTLGLVDLSLRRTNKVGVFRPIIHSKGIVSEKDDHLELLLKTFNLDLDFEECYAVTRDQASDLVGQGKIGRLVEKVIAKFKKLEKKCDEDHINDVIKIMSAIPSIKELHKMTGQGAHHCGHSAESLVYGKRWS